MEDQRKIIKKHKVLKFFNRKYIILGRGRVARIMVT
jgi:hypothetical protein